MNPFGKRAGAAFVLAAIMASLTAAAAKTEPASARVSETRRKAAVKRAIQRVQSDLLKLRRQFFELRDIERVRVSKTKLTYTYGLLDDDKASGPTFSKFGCDIYLEIRYPATKGDLRGPIEGQLVQLKDGSSYAVWKMVRTEHTEAGEAFTDKINEVISKRLEAMNSEMETN